MGKITPIVVPDHTEKISVPAIGKKDVWVTPGVVDVDAAYLYSNGQCAALAIALSRKLSAPLRLVAYRFHANDNEAIIDEDEQFKDDVPFEWITESSYHAVVEVGPDQFLDISGVTDKVSLLRRCFMHAHEGALTTTSEAQLMSIFDSPKQDIATAELFVDAVLEKHLSVFA